jgi:integrase
MLWQWLDKYEEFVRFRVSESTHRTTRHRISEWCQRQGSGVPSAQSIEIFRNQCLEEGLRPRTIESVVDYVRRVASHNGHPLPLGKKLQIPKPSPDVPTVADIDRIYRKVSKANWPSRVNLSKRCDWWRAYLVLCCWCGFRLGDVAALTWKDVTSDAVILSAIKTKRYGRAHLAVPMTMPMRRHLESIRGLFGESIFGLTSCWRQLRRELESIATAAGVKYVPPHGLRRFAINQWSAADSMAGRIIQGESLGTMAHYLDVHRHLSRVAPSVEMPDAFYSPSELERRHDAEQSLLAAYRAAKEPERQLLISLAQKLA